MKICSIIINNNNIANVGEYTISIYSIIVNDNNFPNVTAYIILTEYVE